MSLEIAPLDLTRILEPLNVEVRLVRTSKTPPLPISEILPPVVMLLRVKYSEKLPEVAAPLNVTFPEVELIVELATSIWIPLPALLVPLIVMAPPALVMLVTPSKSTPCFVLVLLVRLPPILMAPLPELILTVALYPSKEAFAIPPPVALNVMFPPDDVNVVVLFANLIPESAEELPVRVMLLVELVTFVAAFEPTYEIPMNAMPMPVFCPAILMLPELARMLPLISTACEVCDAVVALPVMLMPPPPAASIVDPEKKSTPSEVTGLLTVLALPVIVMASAAVLAERIVALDKDTPWALAVPLPSPIP